MNKTLIKKNFSIIKSKTRCNDFRKRILEVSQQVKALHLGGAFSSLEIADFVYYGLMSFKNKLPNDYFIMSKGHSAIAQYIILENLGILKKRDLDNYCTKHGILGAHPDYGNPGIEASTGSLGHGMALATGIAYSNQILNNNKKTFVILSDGELQEGSTWESIMMAANLKVKNLYCFLDHNGSQSFGVTKITHPKFYPIKDKIKSFGWDVKEVNGHNQNEFVKLFKTKKLKSPLFIICNTVKGKGVSYMENKPIWHYRSPTQNEYTKAIMELNKNEK